MWRRKQEDESVDRPDASGFWRSAWVAFVVVFIAEWGDLTQLATAALAARTRSPYVVFAGAALALWSVAAVVFALIGAALLAGIL